MISSSARLRRNGAQPGDIIVSVGQCGRFASAYLRAKQSGFDNLSIDEQAILIRPVARIREMQLLHSRGLITAASDNSDGVLGAVWNIAERSKCTIEIDMLSEALPDNVIQTASEFGYDPWNLMFFWGDWQVIAAIAANRIDEFWNIVREFDIPVQPLGRCSKGSPQLLGVRGGHKQRLRLLRNENFVHDSYNVDMATHIETMLCSCLYTSG
jgi:thiamine monophosphate kinase